MSCAINLLGLGPPCRLAHLESKYLMYSMGGVAANSSGLRSFLISFATILDLWFGHMSSPLFTSIHLSFIGCFPVTLRHSSL